MSGSLTVAAAFAVSAAVGTANLPPLPDHASGILCTQHDGIDRTNTDFMRKKIEAVVASGEITQPGWRVVAAGYDIPWMIAKHSNIELLTPKGEMFASIDTQNISREDGSIKSYFFGEYAAPTQDDCREGNRVVKDDNLVFRRDLITGNGYQAMAGFAIVAERAVENGKANFDYQALFSDGITSTNSNGLTRAHGKALGVDLERDFNNASLLGSYGFPGAGKDLTERMTEQYGPSFYSDMKQPNQIVTDAKYYEQFLGDLARLHPISQQKQAIHFGEAAQIPKP